MQDCSKVQVVDTSQLSAPTEADDLYCSRKNAYTSLPADVPGITVLVIAYNRLEKTKRCVSSILKYTSDIPYELLLVDNGSEDGTLSYFESVPHPQKRIVRITKNLGSQYALNLALRLFSGRYFVQVTNDVVVTRNWLANLLHCMESDPKIGMVTPGSSNISNLQEIPLVFSSYEEMQREAADYNRSDPKKWEERLRLITVVLVLRRELIDLAGMIDRGFFHDFGDDDFSVRVRRAGYKLMLCMDTFVHHDHDFRHGEDKDMTQFQRSLELGRKNFTDKYYGLDSWTDMSNYEGYLAQSFPGDNIPKLPDILGVDTLCGLPILQIKNELRHRGVMNAEAAAFTSEAKYVVDLHTVCGTVACDRIERIPDFLENKNFDYIVLGKPINAYPEVPRLLRALLKALRPSGTLFLKLQNTHDVKSFLMMMGRSFPLEEFVTQIGLEQFNQMLQLLEVSSCKILSILHQMDAESQKALRQTLTTIGLAGDVDTALRNLMTKEYSYCIRK